MPRFTPLSRTGLAAPGQQVDGLINALAGSYVIGNGAGGTVANPSGGAAGWLLGDGRRRLGQHRG